MKSLSVMLAMAVALVSCGDDSSGDTNAANRIIVEKQVEADFGNEGDISALKVNVERGYQVAEFVITPPAPTTTVSNIAATTRDMTAWYEITDATAVIKMDAEDLGVTMPDDLKTAFETTPKYSVTTDWTVTEVEIDTKYIGSVKTQVYEIELDNVTNTNLEAELYYSFDTPIQLLYSKETLDDDDNDDDKVVIDQRLIDAVELLYPSPVTVIDAEMDGTQVEVEAIVTDNNVSKEVEVVFTDITYTTVASQEIETTFIELPAEILSALHAWFEATGAEIVAFPPDTAEATLDTITTNSVITYEVELEYIGDPNNTNYEVELMLDAQYKVTKAEVNDENMPVTP